MATMTRSISTTSENEPLCTSTTHSARAFRPEGFGSSHQFDQVAWFDFSGNAVSGAGIGVVLLAHTRVRIKPLRNHPQGIEGAPTANVPRRAANVQGQDRDVSLCAGPTGAGDYASNERARQRG
jgi:hypothetical protein